MIHYTDFPCPLGTLRAAVEDEHLLGLWFLNQQHFPPTAGWVEEVKPLHAEVRRQMEEYFAGKRRTFDLPLRPRGTDFQQRVWGELLRIPYGETTNYGKLAENLGKPSASRAVGAATGRNPISVIVPCHRLVGANGSLTGYAGGLDRKQELLRLERQ